MLMHVSRLSGVDGWLKNNIMLDLVSLALLRENSFEKNHSAPSDRDADRDA
jgi:hypothetical protein